jgi:hypothetical protein
MCKTKNNLNTTKNQRKPKKPTTVTITKYVKPSVTVTPFITIINTSTTTPSSRITTPSSSTTTSTSSTTTSTFSTTTPSSRITTPSSSTTTPTSRITTSTSSTTTPTSSTTTPTSSTTTSTSSTTPTSSTTTPTSVKLITDSNIMNILEDQNRERRLQNLTDFTWSIQMAQEAVEWSKTLANDNCNLVHELDTARGQNLYGIYGSTSGSVENAVQAWIDEKNLMSNPNVTSSEIGHYLIVVAPHLVQVGCGLAINTFANCLVATCNYT